MTGRASDATAARGNRSPPLIWSATPTPFLDDGSLDERSIERMVDQHRAHGISGIFLAGSCGEGRFMAPAQVAELIRTVRRLCGDSMCLTVQAADRAVSRVRDNARRFHEAGADAVLMALPGHAGWDGPEAVRRYFLEALDGISIPAGLYLLPCAEIPGIDDGGWDELAAHPQVTIIKDSTRSDRAMRRFGAVRRTREDLKLLSGDEFDVVKFFDHGYDGALLGTGILIGGMIRRVLDAHACGDDRTARAWQARSNALLSDLFREDLSQWPSGLKYILVRMGVFSSEFSHMRRPMTDDDRRRIDAAFSREREVIAAAVSHP